MLNRLTVKGRMYIINVSILVLFITMIMFAIYNNNAVKGLGIHKAGVVMLEDQKARIHLATHSAALIIGGGDRRHRRPETGQDHHPQHGRQNHL